MPNTTKLITTLTKQPTNLKLGSSSEPGFPTWFPGMACDIRYGWDLSWDMF